MSSSYIRWMEERFLLFTTNDTLQILSERMVVCEGLHGVF